MEPITAEQPPAEQPPAVYRLTAPWNQMPVGTIVSVDARALKADKSVLLVDPKRLERLVADSAAELVVAEPAAEPAKAKPKKGGG